MERKDRLRRVISTVLVVVGSIGLVVASMGWWLERNLLDTGRFTGTANAILDRHEVQHELTNVLVRRLSQAAGTDLQIAEPFLATVVTQVVDSGAFRAVFDRALTTAHHVLVDESTSAIILDLTDAYDQIKGPLQQVAPKLAAKLPSRRRLNVVVLHRSQLTTAWGVVDRVKRTVRIISVVSILLLAGGIALALRRWHESGARGLGGRRRSHDHGAGSGARACVSRSAHLRLRSFERRGRRVRRGHPPADRPVGGIGVVALGVAFAARFTDRHGRDAWVPAVKGGGHGSRARCRTLQTVARLYPPRLPRSRMLACPSPASRARAVHVWRAVALAAVGLFAVLDPGGLVTLIVVVIGVGVLYLAITEGVAAAGSPGADHS